LACAKNEKISLIAACCGLAGKDAAGKVAQSYQAGALICLTDDGWALKTVAHGTDAANDLAACLAETSMGGSVEDNTELLSTYLVTSSTDAIGSAF
jgi:hypothetical protein